MQFWYSKVEQPLSAPVVTAAGESSGHLVANILSGSWRATPPELTIPPEQVEKVAPLLLAAGAAGLGWRRLCNSDHTTPPAVLQLRDAYRFSVLQAALLRSRITGAIALLRASGVEPVLVKGWAIARLYPDEGLRPYGDVDLCVRPERYGTARNILNCAEGRQYGVDLHEGFRNLDGLSTNDLYARSQLIKLDGTEVRVVAPEDHLRILAIHMLRHGICRPLWLCDIAVALESRPADFDWERCLGKDGRKAAWVACAIGLAHQLVGARVADTPVAARPANLPKWLTGAALRQWGTPFRMRYPLLNFLRRPRGVFGELRHHWPNAIEATVNVNGPFNNFPRLPFQLGDCFRRTALWLAQLPKSFGRRRL